MASIVSIRTAVADHRPEVDNHLVEPGTPYEMWDGELVYVPPCDAPHGTSQATLASLLSAHVAPGLAVACELLTRTSRVDDVAPDVSVFPAAPHPVTGRRQLQHLAFEVVSTQRMVDAGGKAAKLAGRGVRRVFAIDLQRSQVLEWSVAQGRWEELPVAGHITDPALAVPLPIAPLLDAARAEDAVARALIAQGNAVVTSYRAEGRAEGIAEGKAAALLVVLAARGIAIDAASRGRILGERDPARLDGWLARAAHGRTLADVLAER